MTRMSALAAAILLAVAVAGCGGAADKSQSRVIFQIQNGSPADRELIQPAFAAAVQTLNREIGLPHPLTVRLIGDDEANRLGIEGPTYVARDRTVYFPWSFVDESRRELPQSSALRDAMLFVLYHETAHGIVDLTDVPIVGGEERAADSFASIFALRSARGGSEVPLGMAKLFKTKSEGERRAGPYAADDYADDHELDPQRAADAFCLVYGSDPARYRELVGRNLPEGRAAECRFDYQKELRAWRRLLADWLTEQGGLRPEQ